MKKNIFKLIALSLVPMTLMSFKGNESFEQIDGDKIVGQIKKATEAAANYQVKESDFGGGTKITNIEPHDPPDGEPENYRSYWLSLSSLWTMPDAAGMNYAIVYLAKFTEDTQLERTYVSTARYFNTPSDSNRVTVQTNSLGTWTADLYTYGTEATAFCVMDQNEFSKWSVCVDFLDRSTIEVNQAKPLEFKASSKTFSLGQLASNYTATASNGQNVDGLRFKINDFEITSSTPYTISKTDRYNEKITLVVFGEWNRITYQQNFDIKIVNDVLDNGEEKTIFINIDNPASLDQIKLGIHAKDLFGADAPIEYAVKEGSTEYNPAKLGTYSYTITANAYGQTATATLNIIVSDTVAPTISNTTPVSVPYSQGLKLSDLDGKFSASDNAADKGGTIDPLQYYVGDTQIDNDHPYAISIDQAKAGKLTLTVKATDSSKNTGSADFDVTITDDKAPEILSGGKAVVEGTKYPTSLKLFKNADAAKSAFLAGFTAQDEIDSDAPSVEVINFPTLDNVVVGDNEVTLSAVDHAGNRKNVNVIVEVTNDQLPVFVFDSFLVSATSDNPLTADQLATLVSNHLYSTLNVVVSKEDIRVASSTYEESAKIPGKYSIQYSYKKADGTYSDAQSFDVMVSGAKETTWWDDFIRALSEFFQRLWNWICGRGWKTNAEIRDEQVLSSGKDA